MDKAKESIQVGIDLLELQIEERKAQIAKMTVGKPEYDELVGKCAVLKVAHSKAMASVQWIERL